MMPQSAPISDSRVRRLLFVVNADWFFVSHRLRLARACLDAGYEVHVASEESDKRREIEAAGIHFHRIPFERGGTNPFKDAQTIAALFLLYRSLRPDFVHHVTSKPNLYGGLISRVLGTRSVHAVSGLGYVFIDSDSQNWKRKILRPALLRTYRLSMRRRDARVIFQNPTDMNDFVQKGLVEESQCVLIHGSGVDTFTFKATPIPEGPPLVVLPARMLWDKGVGEFVKAARIVRGRNPSVQFLLAGRHDPENPAAVDLAQLQTWQKDGVVTWEADHEHKDMPLLYQRATLVVLPSYREGLSLTLAEAASSARACITTDVPGCRDAIIEGDTGWLVKPRNVDELADAISDALADRDELVRRASKAAEFARKQFDQRVIFEQTMNTYETLAQKRVPSDFTTR